MYGLIANINDFSSFNLIVSFNRVSITPEVKMETGTVKWFNQNKGFGFIDNGTEQDMFFHRSAVEDVRFEDLREGQRVSYDIGQGVKGPCAENVRMV